LGLCKQLLIFDLEVQFSFASFTMASEMATHLKPNGGAEFEKRHHGKTQSHVVR